MGLKSKIRGVAARSVDDVKQEAVKAQTTSVIQLHAEGDFYVRSGVNAEQVKNKYKQLVNTGSDQEIVRGIYQDLKFPSSFGNGAVTWSVVSEVGRVVRAEKQSINADSITYEFDGNKLEVVRIRSRS